MKRRLAAIVCAAALGVTSLTGCASGKQETTAGTETAAAAATENAADEESKAEAGGETAARKPRRLHTGTRSAACRTVRPSWP